MQWNRIVNSRVNARHLQVIHQTRAVSGANHVEVVDSARPERFVGKDYSFVARQETVVLSCMFAATRVPLCNMWQLGGQNPGLDCIQPSIVAFHVVVILLCLTMIAQHPDSACQRAVVRSYCSAFATRSEILPWIKAECRSAAHRPWLHPAVLFLWKVFGAVRLARILNHNQAVMASQPQNRIHVGHLTVEMHWHNRGDPPSAAP